MYNADGYAKDGAHVPFFSAQSWPRLLRYKKYQADSQANSASVCHGCRYSLKIRDHVDVLAGHLRTYIWQGGNYPADLKDEAGNPDPKAGMEWCFEYGEEEWMEPEKHPLTKKTLNWQGYKDLATAISSRRVACE